MQVRSTLLAKNRELLQLHKELVDGKILTEEEFWETRRALLQGQEIVNSQRRAPSSTLISEDLKPSSSTTSTAASGTGEVKYVLTPAIQEAILEEYPVLKRAKAELVVAGQMAEKDFWIEYIKSKFFKGGQKRTGGSSALDKYFDQQFEPDDAIDGGSEQLEEAISGFMNVSRSRDDHVSDYVRSEQDSFNNEDDWNVLRQLNRHSLRVLHASASTRYQMNDSMIELKDLTAKNEQKHALLNVREQTFSLAKVESKAEENFNEANEQLLKELGGGRSTEQIESIDYKSSKAILNNVLERNGIVPVDRELQQDADAGSLNSESAALVSTCTEILQHFWKAQETTNPSERQAKSARMIAVLLKMEQKIADMDTERQAGFFGNVMSIIQEAKTRYDSNVQ